MPLDFSPYHAVLLDLDGTICTDDTMCAGAAELVRRLQSEGRKFACLSNSSASPLRVMARLEPMGIDIDPDNIYTAAAAACDFVIERFGQNNRPRVFNLATESIDDMLHGMVDWVNDTNEPCDVIVIGGPANVHCTPERQRMALQLARNGAAVVGLCADRVYTSARGLEFGSGAMTWMLAYAAGVEPIFCGKPEPLFFQELCKRLQVDPAWCVLIGDNLESDVAGGKSVGMRTILTLGGVAREEDLAQLAEDQRPDLVVKTLTELL